LEAAGIPASADARRDYRQLLLTAAGLGEHVSGIIVCDETFRQRLTDGRAFPDAAHDLGILPGIKVDTGTEPMDGTGTLLTRGLDGLDERLEEYAAEGAAFAKWRAVIAVDSATPASVEVNAAALAEYARLCQRHGIVPIVEPEVIADGEHAITDCARVSRLALHEVFTALTESGVDLSGTILKPSFVTPGLRARSVSAKVVATITWDVLRSTVPEDMTGIAFLSGGHPTDDVCAYLAALNAVKGVPWYLTFSFGRALVNDALSTWAGSPANVTAAQRTLVERCRAAAQATSAA
ncbi:MAG TPA: fructose-bisphosphate aldolase class I, partial [Nocardioides sp.]|nr:fructose-bisphosphate aldolase class I [Nocardioides sp.]